jgi:hypothetical protein
MDEVSVGSEVRVGAADPSGRRGWKGVKVGELEALSASDGNKSCVQETNSIETSNEIR